MQGLNARDRASYLEARNRWQKAKEVGDRFRDGMMSIRGHTAERGYVKEAHLRDGTLGSRFHDVRNDGLGKAYEYKSGSLDKDKALRQLEKDERYIRGGGSVEWVIVEGARADKEVQAKLKELREKYSRRFTVQEVSREQLRQALTVAKHLERVRDREAREKARQGRERAERERREVRRKEIEVQRKDLARVVEHNTRAIELARGEGRSIPVRELSQAHRSAVRSLREVRAFERSDARQMVAGLGLKGQAARDMERSLEEGRERQRQGVRQGIDSMGREAGERAVVVQREAQWQERKRERQRELEGLVRAGQVRADEVRVRLAMEFPTSPGEVARDKARGRVPDDALRLKQARERDGLARERERGLSRER